MRSHAGNDGLADPENPYQPPVDSLQNVRSSESSLRGGRLYITGCAILMPIYLVVFVASVQELTEVKSVFSRDAADYWRHGVASVVFRGICGATLFLTGRKSHYAKYFFVASPLLLIILIYPGLNRVWNAVTGLMWFS